MCSESLTATDKVGTLIEGGAVGQRFGPSGRLGRADGVIPVVVGPVVLGMAMTVVRAGHVPSWERDVFEAINGLPGALYPVLWPFQQIGAVLVGPLVAVIALVRRHRRLALAALAVTVGKLVSERLVKATVSRSRPYTSIGPDITMRGDVPRVGESFVSGHAVLVTALAGIITPYLPGRWKVLPWICVVLVALGRVYVGAHLPLDVVGGAGLGLILAGLANLAIGVPAGSRASG